MTSFYYYDQNPSEFCFLVQIRAFVTLKTSLGFPNLNMKEKVKSILVEVVNDAIVQMAYSTRTLIFY